MAKKNQKDKPKTISSPIGKKPLLEVANLELEKDERIQKLAEDKNVALISFIAPYVPVRVSPIEETSATIGLPDEFGIDILIDLLKDAGIKDAYLLINSPGGTMTSSYKIAKDLRIYLDKLITFVPHIAASGGTLFALSGDEIVMGPMSHLTPLDVQIAYKGTTVSAGTFMKIFSRTSKWFEKLRPEEAPYPQRALADKLDPFLMEEWSGYMETAISYVEEILSLAKYKDSDRIAQNLVLSFPSHGYVITQDKARDLGLRIKNPEEMKDIWDIMRLWLSKYILKEEVTHCIRYALPSKNKKNEEANKKEIKNASKM